MGGHLPPMPRHRDDDIADRSVGNGSGPSGHPRRPARAPATRRRQKTGRVSSARATQVHSGSFVVCLPAAGLTELDDEKPLPRLAQIVGETEIAGFVKVVGLHRRPFRERQRKVGRSEHVINPRSSVRRPRWPAGARRSGAPGQNPAGTPDGWPSAHSRTPARPGWCRRCPCNSPPL